MPLPQIRLSDGQSVDYQLKRSSKARYLRLSISAHSGVQLTVPLRCSERRIAQFLQSKFAWLDKHLQRFAAQGFESVNTGASDVVDPAALLQLLPSEIMLPAVSERWQIMYFSKPLSTELSLKVIEPFSLWISGALDQAPAIMEILHKWLRQRACAVFSPMLMALSQELTMTYKRLTVRAQRTRWGSCSAQGAISLNDRLLFLSPELMRHVMIHELCHLREPNHSANFWSLVTRFDPQTPQHRINMRNAMWQIPAWAR